MALQAHLICSLCHCLFLPFFFIFVMHLDHRPPEIFLHFTTCTLEAFLSTSPLKQHHSHLSAHTEETRETATLVFFFTNTEQPEVYTQTKKAFQDSAIPGLQNHRILLRPHMEYKWLLDFLWWKNKLFCTKGKEAREALTWGIASGFWQEQSCIFRLLLLFTSNSWAWVIVQFQTAILCFITI